MKTLLHKESTAPAHLVVLVVSVVKTTWEISRTEAIIAFLLRTRGRISSIQKKFEKILLEIGANLATYRPIDETLRSR